VQAFAKQFEFVLLPLPFVPCTGVQSLLNIVIPNRLFMKLDSFHIKNVVKFFRIKESRLCLFLCGNGR
jgi:hypothetical protein